MARPPPETLQRGVRRVWGAPTLATAAWIFHTRIARLAYLCPFSGIHQHDARGACLRLRPIQKTFSRMLHTRTRARTHALFARSLPSSRDPTLLFQVADLSAFPYPRTA